jgi:hypothetical protein
MELAFMSAPASTVQQAPEGLEAHQVQEKNASSSVSRNQPHVLPLLVLREF